MKLKNLRIVPPNVDHSGAFYFAAVFQPSTHAAAIAYCPKPKARNDEFAVRNVDWGGYLILDSRSPRPAGKPFLLHKPKLGKKAPYLEALLSPAKHLIV